MILQPSLRARLGLLLVLAFCPVLGLTVYSAYLHQEEQLAENEASEMRLARQIATTYAQAIARAHELLGVFARVPAIRRLDASACNAMAAEIIRTSAQYANLSVALPNGDLFCSGVPATAPVNVRQMATFARALESRGFAVGDYVISLISGRPILGMAIPVLGQRSEVVAVAGVLLSVDWLNRVAATAALPEGARLSIVDGAGRIVVHHPDPERWVGKLVTSSAMFAAAARGDARYEGRAFDGAPSRVSFATVAGVPAPAALHVGIAIDPERALAPLRAALYRDLGVLFGVALLAFAGAWVGTERTVLRRVNALLDATRRLAAGELGARAGVGRGPSELLQLGRAFDDMAAALQERELRLREDLQERKRAEEALREGALRLQMAAKAGNVGLWDWNLQTQRVFYSSEWKRQIGYEDHEISDDYAEWRDRLHPDDLERVTRLTQAMLEDQGSDYRAEFRFRHKDGSYRWIFTQAALISDERGKPNRMLGSHVDITERKSAEEARQKLEIQLRLSQKMEALGTLAGGIAHDFNNILAAIIGNLHVARRRSGELHPAEDNLAEIDKAAERARVLVKQILAFSGPQPQERRVLELREVVEDSVQLLRAILPAGIDLVTTFADDVPNVLADPTQIHQVLMNLCTNARDAMHGATGRIEVSLAAAVVRDGELGANLTPGRYARLVVTDDGQGMDAVTRERIFDPFFTTKAPGAGTGLGLAVVAGIMKHHGGVIAVDSEPGRGTSLRLYFPAVGAQTEALPAASAELPCGSGQRVCYLDDEAPLVRLAAQLLQPLGYEVVGFTHPQKALAAFLADPTGFDLLVTDLNMPLISGLDVAREVLRVRHDLPIAITSGYLTEELRAEAHALGIRELIGKPYAIEDLAEALHRMHQHRPVHVDRSA
jgi:PAS domain S-box-containing protein